MPAAEETKMFVRWDSIYHAARNAKIEGGFVSVAEADTTLLHKENVVKLLISDHGASKSFAITPAVIDIC